MHDARTVAQALLEARLGMSSRPYRPGPRDPVHGLHNPTARARRRARCERLEMGRLEQRLNQDLDPLYQIRTRARREWDPQTGLAHLVITHESAAG